MTFNNQSEQTRFVVDEMAKHRLSRGKTWADMAYSIEHGHHYRITADEYRAIEQGLTKRVPLDVFLYSCVVLEVEPEDVLGAAKLARNVAAND